MKIVYLHGLGSGAESRTPKTLRTFLPNDEILAPEIPINPLDGYAFVRRFAEEQKPDLVIGTSLGGFYAMGVPGVRKLVVNPAMYADEDIEKGIGLGEQPFFLPRSNGATTYIIDRAFIDALKTVRDSIYATIDDREKELTYGFFGTKDALLDHYADFCALYGETHATRFEGEHRLSPENIERSVLPQITKFYPDHMKCTDFGAM